MDEFVTGQYVPELSKLTSAVKQTLAPKGPLEDVTERLQKLAAGMQDITRHLGQHADAVFGEEPAQENQEELRKDIPRLSKISNLYDTTTQLEELFSRLCYQAKRNCNL